VVHPDWLMEVASAYFRRKRLGISEGGEASPSKKKMKFSQSNLT
jgi:hypothetical protein